MAGSYPNIVAKVNKSDVRFIVDTGAAVGAMSQANAEALGLKQEPAPPSLRPSGIGGQFDAKITKIRSFELLGIELHDVPFMVGGTDAGMGVIGADLIDAVDLDIDLAKKKLRLMKVIDCDSLPATYWPSMSEVHTLPLRKVVNAGDRRSFVTVLVNGHPVNALLDSGTASTLLSRVSAERIGIKVSQPLVRSGPLLRGIGPAKRKTWIVPVPSISIGDEVIKNSEITIVDGNLSDNPSGAEMLLGVDYLLSHHVVIATSQQKIYSVYNGRKVFVTALSAVVQGKSFTAGN